METYIIVALILAAAALWAYHSGYFDSDKPKTPVVVKSSRSMLGSRMQSGPQQCLFPRDDCEPSKWHKVPTGGMCQGFVPEMCRREQTLSGIKSCMVRECGLASGGKAACLQSLQFD